MKILYPIFLLCLLLVSSCGGSSHLVLSDAASHNPSPKDETSTLHHSAQATTTTSHLTPTSTVTAKPSQTPITPTTTSTNTATITPTITPTPQPLSLFSPSGLSLGVSPVGYLENDCRYLDYRWDEDKSGPGTIVVPIMFHSIVKPGREITDSSSISREYFDYFMDFAKDMGFSTITVDELIDFLEVNEKIPERSMILILDDRRPGTTELFMPYLEENDWTLTLAWPTTDETRESLWMQMEGLAQSGRLDVQSHGHDHIYIQDYTPMEEVEEEIYRPIEVIQDHFGTTPASIIWPGGNYTKSALELAREAGLKLGFTVYSRGPLMFNWIPLGELEKEMDDPLLVLPRYWSTAADVALLQAVDISEAVKGEAQAVKAEEMRYYYLYCQTGEGE